MNKRLIIPVVVIIIIIVIAIFSCLGGSSKISIEFKPVKATSKEPSSIQLNVYVENSGSMDGYMCAGSNLKDAVYDYVSDLSKYSSQTNLYYINSQLIRCNQPLNEYIQKLTPSSFSAAGGNRTNTDLRKMIDIILRTHKSNVVSIFVSDCILDIPENAIDFFGNCEVSIKNSFNEALKKDKDLGVQILRMQSKFNGYWYCGANKEFLKNVKRPYYIWIIGNKRVLADFNKKVPTDNIIGGVQDYCAYTSSGDVPFDIDKKRYVINHTGKVNVEILADLSCSLQNAKVLENTGSYSTSDQVAARVINVQPITVKDSKYSHVINVELSNPKTLKSETVTFSYPVLPSWVKSANDDKGVDVKKNIDKTTGIQYLIKGVSDAYKGQSTYGSITFNIKNK